MIFNITSRYEDMAAPPGEKLRQGIYIPLAGGAMDDYRGCTIRVAVYPDQNGVTFHATYSVHRGPDKVACGTIAGGLKTIAEAEHAAQSAALRWIDQQT